MAGLGAALTLFTAGCIRTSGGAWYVSEAPLPEGWPELSPVGTVVVRQVPAYRVAVNRGEPGRASMDGLFRPLFNHIKRRDIAMTTPVEMGYDRGAMASMGFLYRRVTQGEAGVDAADPSIEVVDVPAQTVVSVGVRGRYRQGSADRAVGRLREWLAGQDEYEAAGEPRVLGYNSPFVPGWMRYAEVQVPVRRVGE